MTFEKRPIFRLKRSNEMYDLLYGDIFNFIVTYISNMSIKIRIITITKYR